jgi:hypothetical protein
LFVPMRSLLSIPFLCALIGVADACANPPVHASAGAPGPVHASPDVSRWAALAAVVHDRRVALADAPAPGGGVVRINLPSGADVDVDGRWRPGGVAVDVPVLVVDGVLWLGLRGVDGVVEARGADGRAIAAVRPQAASESWTSLDVRGARWPVSLAFVAAPAEAPGYPASPTGSEHAGREVLGGRTP